MTTSLIIIPAFNEAENILHVIKKIPSKYTVLVINDGSNDGTGELQYPNNVKLIHHQENMGYERALQTGIEFFKNSHFDNLVVIDADGEIDPNDAIGLLSNLTSRVHVVCGFRIGYQGRLSERISGKLVKKLFGIDDIFCGCKAFSRSVLENELTSDICQNAFTGFVLRYSRLYQVANEGIRCKKRVGDSRYGGGIFTEIILLVKILKSILIRLFVY